MGTKDSVSHSLLVRVTTLLILIGAIPALGACSTNPNIVLTENTSPSMPTSTTISRTTENAPAQSSIVDVVVTPTLWPVSVDCAGGLIAFEVFGSADYTVAQSGLYLACSDGTFSQRVLEESSTGLSASPDHTKLAIVDYRQADTGRIQLLDLSNYSLDEVISHLPSAWDVRWSPDSEYVGYLHGAG